jgi:TRAP-type mannitol/chloroaromatic compound transport system permease small subunit
LSKAPSRFFTVATLDNISRVTGRIVAWLTLAMVLVTFLIVVMRYVFDAGLIWLQESVIWMHGAVFMLGAAYTLLEEEHVRVDIFYRQMSDRQRAVTDALGVMLFLLPVCGYLAYASFDFALASWTIRETSREPGGLAYPMIPMLKSIIVVMPVLVGLQGLAMLARAIGRIREG